MTALPTLDNLATVAARLAEIAHDAGDKANENALNKAIHHLQCGTSIIETTGGYLVPSGTRSGVIHRVSEQHGCNCEAGSNGRTCWHQSAVEIIMTAQEPRRADHDRAIHEMDELFA